MTLRSHLYAAFLVSALQLKVHSAVDAARDDKSPMPPAIKVIITLCAQYFLTYFLLQAAQTNSQMKTPGVKGMWEKILGEAVLTVDFCPMLGVLFLAVRMRAQQLWPPDGKVPEWAQQWMWLCSIGVLMATLLSVVQPWLSGSYMVAAGGSEDKLLGGGGARPRPGSTSFVINYIFGALKVFSLLFIYVGFVVVIFALFELPSPAGSSTCSTCAWEYTPPIAPAVQCVINLTIQYFGVYLALQVAKLWSNTWNHGRRTFAIRTLESAVPSVKLCPMLAILFVGARMRALQMNLEAPPLWAQMAFYLCTWACLTQTICAILTPIATGEANAGLDEDGNVVTTSAGSSGLPMLLTFIRYIALIVLVAGVVVSGYSIFAMEAPYGETPPVSTTVKCVLNLTVQFLAVTLMLTVTQTYSQVMLGGMRTDAQQVLEAAVPTLAFIPMLRVLFVATRMRALQLDPKGNPQPYVQMAMEVASWAVLLQMVAAMGLPFLTGELDVMIESPTASTILNVTKYVGVAVTFLGVGAIVHGVCTL
jgi:hypothetical protein